MNMGSITMTWSAILIVDSNQLSRKGLKQYRKLVL